MTKWAFGLFAKTDSTQLSIAVETVCSVPFSSNGYIPLILITIMPFFNVNAYDPHWLKLVNRAGSVHV